MKKTSLYLLNEFKFFAVHTLYAYEIGDIVRDADEIHEFLWQSYELNYDIPRNKSVKNQREKFAILRICQRNPNQFIEGIVRMSCENHVRFLCQ